MDNKAYQKMDYALCLLSAAADGKRHGCIVNSFHQVTSSFPPKFTVAVNKDHETCRTVQASGSFSVTLLASDAPAEIIDTFGYRSGRVTDKFAGREVFTSTVLGGLKTVCVRGEEKEDLPAGLERRRMGLQEYFISLMEEEEQR